jgi:hypothetical protein
VNRRAESGGTTDRVEVALLHALEAVGSSATSVMLSSVTAPAARSPSRPPSGRSTRPSLKLVYRPKIAPNRMMK